MEPPATGADDEASLFGSDADEELDAAHRAATVGSTTAGHYNDDDGAVVATFSSCHHPPAAAARDTTTNTSKDDHQPSLPPQGGGDTAAAAAVSAADGPSAAPPPPPPVAAAAAPEDRSNAGPAIDNDDGAAVAAQGGMAMQLNSLGHFQAHSRLHFIGRWVSRAHDVLKAMFEERPERDHGLITQRTFVHVDMDCFFCAVALAKPENAHLRDKPVAVFAGGRMSEISSCNYVARKFGVRAGMWAKQAYALCPALQSLSYDFPAYERVNRVLYEALFENCPVGVSMALEVISVDEVIVALDSADVTRTAVDYAHRVRADMAEKTGCPCSAGIACTISAARMATGVAKPNGVLAVPAHETATFVASRPAKELHGVGRQTYAKLAVLVRAFRVSPEKGAEVADDIKRHGREAKALANAEAVRKRLMAGGMPFSHQQQQQPAPVPQQPLPPGMKLVAPSGAHHYYHQGGHADPPPATTGRVVDGLVAADDGGGGEEHAQEHEEPAAEAVEAEDDPAALLEGLSCRDLLVVPAAAMRAALGRNLGEAMRKMLLGEDGRVAKRTGTTDGLKPPLSVGCTMNYALRMAAFGELLRVFTDVVKDVVGKLDRHGLATGSLKVTVLERHPTYKFYPDKTFGCGKCVERCFPVKFETGGEWRVNKLLDAITPGLRALVGDPAAGVKMRADTADEILHPELLGAKETPSATLRGIAIDAAAAAAATADAHDGGQKKKKDEDHAGEDIAAAGGTDGGKVPAVPVWDVRGVGLVASMLVPRQALLDRELEQQRRGIHAVQQVSLTAAFRNAQARRAAAAGTTTTSKRPRKNSSSSSVAASAAVDVDDVDDESDDDSNIMTGSSVVVNTLGSNDASDVVVAAAAAGTTNDKQHHCSSEKLLLVATAGVEDPTPPPPAVVDLLMLSAPSGAAVPPAPLPTSTSTTRTVGNAVAQGAADTLRRLAGFGGVEACSAGSIGQLRVLLADALRSVKGASARGRKQHCREARAGRTTDEQQQPWIDVVAKVASVGCGGDGGRWWHMIVLAVAAVLRAFVAAAAASRPALKVKLFHLTQMADLERLTRSLRVAAFHRHAAAEGASADDRHLCAGAVSSLIYDCVGPSGWAQRQFLQPAAAGETPLRSVSAMFGAPQFTVRLV